MFVGLEVQESGDILLGVVNGVAAAALVQYLPVFEPGDDVFDAGWDALVALPGVWVADGAAGAVTARW